MSLVDRVQGPAVVVGVEDLGKEAHLPVMKLVGVCRCSFGRKVVLV